MTEFFCALCKLYQKFESLDHLEAHIAESHVFCLPYSCTLCPSFGGRYPTETAIIMHMKHCHNVDGEYKFMASFSNDTLEKRAQIRDILQRCVDGNVQQNITGNCIERKVILSSPSQPHIHSQSVQVTVHKPNMEDTSQKCNQQTSLTNINVKKKETRPTISNNKDQKGELDKDIITSKPPKIPRIAIAGRNNNPELNNSNNQPQLVSKVVLNNGVSGQSVEETQTLKTATPYSTPQQEKKNTISNKPTRIKEKDQKEKKNQEKKNAEIASKGGYNHVNIDNLFTEMDTRPLPAITDEEHSEGDSIGSKDDSAPLKVSKGIPQQDFELPPIFFGSKPSSKLGLVLLKADASEHRSKAFRSQASIPIVL